MNPLYTYTKISFAIIGHNILDSIYRDGGFYTYEATTFS